MSRSYGLVLLSLFFAVNIAACASNPSVVNPQDTDTTQTHPSTDREINVTIAKDPVAYYPFNGNANDESGNQNNAVIYGAIPSTDRFGKLNSAYYFDGVDDQITASLPQDYFSSDFTISAWVKFANFNTDYPAILQVGHGTIAFHGMGPVYGGLRQHIGFYQQDGKGNTGSRRGEMTSTGKLNTDTWYMLTVVRESLTYRFFINGALDNQKTEENIPTFTGNTVLLSAYDGADNRLNGVIDDVLIYARALTNSEIILLYGQGQ